MSNEMDKAIVSMDDFNKRLHYGIGLSKKQLIDFFAKCNENQRQDILASVNDKAFDLLEKTFYQDEKAVKTMQEKDILTMAKKAGYHTVKYLYQNSPTDILRELLNGFSHLQSERLASGETSDNTDDVFQVACLSICEDIASGTDDELIFANACKAVRRYVYSMGDKGRTTKKVIDGNGNAKTVTVPRYTHLYIDDYEQGNGEIPAYEDVTRDIEHLQGITAINAVIRSIVDCLTIRQKQVLKYKAKGYSNVAISNRLNCSKANVSNIINDIRKTAKTLHPDYAVIFDGETPKPIQGKDKDYLRIGTDDNGNAVYVKFTAFNSWVNDNTGDDFKTDVSLYEMCQK